MKAQNLILVLIFACLFSFGMIAACGDDDDDDDNCAVGGDDDSSSDYDCEDICAALYDECDKTCSCDGVELPDKETCISTCEDHGGLPECYGECLDVYMEDGDCDALEQCKLECDQQMAK